MSSGPRANPLSPPEWPCDAGNQPGALHFCRVRSTFPLATMETPPQARDCLSCALVFGLGFLLFTGRAQRRWFAGCSCPVA